MIYETDLFSFSFVPNWYLQLDALAELALQGPVAVYPAPLYLNRQHGGRFGLIRCW